MKNLLLCAAFAIIATLANTAEAGWSSNGGELFSDVGNPWFLSNTPRVEYCIDIDLVHFGISADVARRRVVAALTYWRKEFASRNARLRFRLATQEFVETPCTEQTLLTFQFGVLSDEQAAYLKYPQRIVAHAVRTGYDQIAMRGRGFIYVSPETGPRALTGGQNLQDIVPTRWQLADGKMLELILIHELGHVFGLTHDEDTFMRAGWPAWVVTSPILQSRLRPETLPPHFFFADTHNRGSFLNEGLTYRASDIPGNAEELLGLPRGHRLEIKARNQGEILEAFAVPQNGSPKVLLGHFEDLQTLITGGDRGAVFAPAGQQAFPFLSPDYSYGFGGPTALRISGWFQREDGRGRNQLLIDVSGQYLQLSGVRSDRILAVNVAYMDNWFAAFW